MTMTDYNDEKPSKHVQRDLRLERVKALFQQADRSHGGFAEHPSQTFADRADKATEPPAAGGVTSGTAQPAGDTNDHRWMLDVLSTLAEYAMREKLYHVSDCIENAQMRIEEMLNPQLLSADLGATGRPDRDRE